MNFISRTKLNFIAAFVLFLLFNVVFHNYMNTPSHLDIAIFLMITTAVVFFLLYYFNDIEVIKLIQEKKELLRLQSLSREKDVYSLYRLSSVLAACKSTGEINHVIADIIPNILPNTSGYVSVIESSRHLLKVKFSWGEGIADDSVYSYDQCWAMKKGKHHFSSDDLVSIRCQHNCQEDDNKMLCIPLIAYGETVGTMTFIFKNQESNKQETNLCFAISEHIGLAISNLQLKEKLIRQTLIDLSTGLYNRRYFDSQLEKDLSKSIKQKHCLSLIMIDFSGLNVLDICESRDFEQAILMKMIRSIKKLLRDYDSVCRISCDELAILLPKSNSDESLSLIKKLVLELKKEKELLTKKLCIGISTFPESSKCCESLLSSCDIALREARLSDTRQFVHYAQLNNNSVEISN
jgi:diguanylate cyclase (GGDEF)-like protein